MTVDYLPATCSCGAGVAGSMISDSRPWYACGTIAGRACIAEDAAPTPPYATDNLALPTDDELAGLSSLAEAFARSRRA